MKNTLTLLLCSLAPMGVAHGDIIDSSYLGGGLIPDSGGVAFSWERTGPPTIITGLTVSLTLSAPPGSAAFNGDIYATLQHVSGSTTAFSVLLNRCGRSDAGGYGYGDNGMTITFDDRLRPSGEPAHPDVHTYRLELTGNHLTPLSPPLTGTWSTDGRNVDPKVVTAATPRTTSLLDFIDLDPNGVWVLYVADTSAGARAKLESWRLQIEIPSAIVPEPAGGAMLVALGLAGFCLTRRSHPPG